MEPTKPQTLSAVFFPQNNIQGLKKTVDKGDYPVCWMWLSEGRPLKPQVWDRIDLVILSMHMRFQRRIMMFLVGFIQHIRSLNTHPHRQLMGRPILN